MKTRLFLTQNAPCNTLFAFALLILNQGVVAQPTNNIRPGVNAVMVDTNGVLQAPTNFFAANSNALNAVVSGGGGGGSTTIIAGPGLSGGTNSGVVTLTNTVSTNGLQWGSAVLTNLSNGNGGGLTNLTGANVTGTVPSATVAGSAATLNTTNANVALQHILLDNTNLYPGTGTISYKAGNHLVTNSTGGFAGLEPGNYIIAPPNPQMSISVFLSSNVAFAPIEPAESATNMAWYYYSNNVTMKDADVASPRIVQAIDNGGGIWGATGEIMNSFAFWLGLGGTNVWQFVNSTNYGILGQCLLFSFSNPTGTHSTVMAISGQAPHDSWDFMPNGALSIMRMTNIFGGAVLWDVPANLPSATISNAATIQTGQISNLLAGAGTVSNNFVVKGSLQTPTNNAGPTNVLTWTDGSNLVATLPLPAANLTGGIADARLSANVPLANAANIFGPAQTFSAGIIDSGPATNYPAWIGAGGSLTNGAIIIGAGLMGTTNNNSLTITTNGAGGGGGGITATQVTNIVSTFGETSSTVSGTITNDWSNLTQQRYTLSGNTTLVFINQTNGMTRTFVVYDPTNYTLTLPGCASPSHVINAQTTNVDVYTVTYSGGTNYLAQLQNLY